jgi:hypothetical protein
MIKKNPNEKLGFKVFRRVQLRLLFEKKRKVIDKENL